MKKLFAVMLVLAVVFVAMPACADDSSKMTFDNVTFGKAYKIKGYASVTLLGFKFVDVYAQWEDGKASAKLDPHENRKHCVYAKKPVNPEGQYLSYVDATFKASGNEADFAWLKADVLNLQKSEAGFMKDIKVQVIYDDEYEYDGWIRQFNYDYGKAEIFSKDKNAGLIGWPVCLSPVDEMSIAPMYKGHYVFGCTLPNAVVEDKDSPLRMEITIGGHKLIHNIR